MSLSLRTDQKAPICYAMLCQARKARLAKFHALEKARAELWSQFKMGVISQASRLPLSSSSHHALILLSFSSRPSLLSLCSLSHLSSFYDDSYMISEREYIKSQEKIVKWNKKRIAISEHRQGDQLLTNKGSTITICSEDCVGRGRS